MRADRIHPNSETCFILTETKTQNIFQQIEATEPDIVVIDSIQTLHTDYIESTAGSISQIRECTAEHSGYPHWPHHQRRYHCRAQNIGAYGRYRIAV